MPLSLNDPIINTRPGFDPAFILGRMEQPDAKDRGLAQAVMTWTRVAGIDPAIVFSQWLLETNNGKSVRWNRDLNASGMGIVSDGTAQPFKIASVDESARLFVQCLYSLVEREAHPDVPLSGDTLRWFNTVWLPKVQSDAMPDVRTVVDLGKRYTENGDSRATWSWEDGKVPQDTYGKKLVSRLSQFYPTLPDPKDPPVIPPTTPEEPVEPGEPMATPETIKPDFVDAYVTKQRDGQGFNYGTRAPIVGLVIHETQGRGTGDWYQKFFSCPNGERCGNALVDWLIDRDGKLWEYQDPYDTNRIPWASGGAANNSNAIGSAINAKYRNTFGGVNAVFAAVEMVKTDAEALTAAQIQTAGRLLAFVMAKAGYPANDWEYPDALGGNICTAPHHSDISQTSCRISDADKAAIKSVCTTALAGYYAGTTPPDELPGTPTTPTAPDIIPGVDLAIAKRFFGIAQGEDGRSYSYDPNGPVSMLWTDRGKLTGEWPKLADVWVYDDGRRYFVFADGSTIFDPAGAEPPRWLMAAAA